MSHLVAFLVWFGMISLLTATEALAACVLDGVLNISTHIVLAPLYALVGGGLVASIVLLVDRCRQVCPCCVKF